MEESGENRCVLTTLAKLREEGDISKVKHFVTTSPARLPSSDFKKVVHFVYAYDEKLDCIDLVRTRLRINGLEIDEIEYLSRLLVDLLEEVINTQKITEKLTQKTLGQDTQLIESSLKKCSISSTDTKVSIL